VLRFLGGILTLLTATGVVAHELLVLDSGTKNILRYSGELVSVPGADPPRWVHALIDTFATVTSGVPRRMAYHPDGRLFVTGGGVEIRDGVTGALLDQFTSGLQPVGLAFGPEGHVFVADWMGHKVLEHDEDGQFLRQFTPEGDGLQEPTEIVFAPNGDLWVASSRDTGIRRYQAGTGYYMGYAISPNIATDNTQAIEFDPFENQLYVSCWLGGTNVFDADTGVLVRNIAIGNGQGILLVPSGRLYAGALYQCTGTGLVSVFEMPIVAPFAGGQIWLPSTWPSGVLPVAQDIVFAIRAVTDAGDDTLAPSLTVRRDGRRVLIAYTLPEAGDIRLSVFDVRGRRLELIDSGPRTAGAHASAWDPRGRHDSAAAGVYFVELRAAEHRAAAKVVVR